MKQTLLIFLAALVLAATPSAQAGSGFAVTSNVTVDTRSSVATLSGLVLSAGTLSPTFAAATPTYTASVTNGTTSITVTPTVTDATATIKVNGITVTSGTASGAISLVVGANLITTVVTAQDGTTVSTYTVTVTRATSYDTWKSGAFATDTQRNDPAISGELAMPARDGITNLMKYALAADPMTCGTAALPTISRNAGYFTLSYRRNKQASDLAYTVQTSDSVTSGIWSTAATVLVQLDMGGYWLVTVRDNVTSAGHPQRYMRLQISH